MFQGVQSPWPRPNASSRSPNASADPARGRALLLAAGHVDPAEQRLPPAPTPRAGSAGPPPPAPARASPPAEAPARRAERPPIAGTTAVTASPSQSPACRSSGTANAAGGDAARSRSASASAATSARVRSFQPTLANATTRPPGADTCTTGFPFGRAAPTRTARSARGSSSARARWWDSTRSGRSASPTPGATAIDARPRRTRWATPARNAAAAAVAARRARAGAPLENCVIAAAAGARRGGRRQDLRAVASTGGRRSARSSASPAELARLQPVRGRRRRPGRGCRHRRFSPRHRTGSRLRGVPDRVDAPIEGGTIGCGRPKVGRRGKFSHDRHHRLRRRRKVPSFSDRAVRLDRRRPERIPTVETGWYESVSLSDYFGVIARRKWIVLLVTVLMTVSAVAYSKNQTPKYQATASLPSPQSSTAEAKAGAITWSQTNAPLADSTTIASIVVGARTPAPIPTVAIAEKVIHPAAPAVQPGQGQRDDGRRACSLVDGRRGRHRRFDRVHGHRDRSAGR